MKFKHFSKSFFAVLLVIAMLLSACAIFASCGGGQEPNQNDPGTNPPASSDCTHAQTTKKNQRAATCVEAGYTGDDVCTACGAVVKPGEAIAVLAHTWDAGQVTKEPTCIEQGVKTITCTGCLTTKTESVSVVAHQDKYHDALDGTHSHTCTTCTLSEFKEHTPTDAGRAYPATCTTDAYVEYTCAVCEGIYRVYSATEKAFGHSYGEWETVAPTCVSAGSKTRVCTVCDEPETIAIDPVPAAHDYVEVGQRKPATCVAAGTIYYQCTHCEGTTTKEIPINHDAHALGSAVQSGSFLRQECALCDFEVSKLVATSTNATVNAGDIETGRALEIETSDANVQFPKDVVSQLTGNKDATVAVNAGVAADKAGILNKAQNLTAEQKERLSSDGVDIYDFGVTVGGAPLSQFDSTITVVLPYTLKEGEDPEGIVIWYVAEDGSVEQYPAVYENGTVTFRTKHFSYYAIAYEETQESKCRRGIHRWMDDPFVQQATCQQLGFTRNECDTCHTVELDHIQERLEHEYGELIQPTVNCTEGGYVHKICAKCDHVLELTYVRATGHTITAVATCTTSVKCETCQEVVRPALGHNMSDWTVIVEPSETTNGQRRRHCPRCGLVENEEIFYTGDIQKLEFNSYEDVLNFLVKDVFNMENGKITLDAKAVSFDDEQRDVKLDITVSKEGASYAMLVDYSFIEDDDVERAQILYRNGVTVRLFDGGVGSTKTLEAVTGDILEELFYMPFEAFTNYFETLFETVAPVYEPVIKELGPLFDTLDALFEKDTGAADVYTPGELATIYLKLKNTYAYWAYKMGFTSKLFYDNTVKVMTRQDILEAISYFMTVTEDANGKHYTWDCTKLMNSLEEVLTWLEENQQKTADVLFWELFGAEITEKFPEITTWDVMIAKLIERFPGTTPMKDTLEDMIAFLDSKKAGTTASLYAMADMIVKSMTGEEFDSEQFLLSFVEEGTLNDLAAAALGEEEATVEALFQMLDEMAKSMTVGSLPIGYLFRTEMTLSEALPMIRETFDRVVLTANLSFMLDQSGKLVSLDDEIKFNYEIGAKDALTIKNIAELKLQILCDDSIKVQIPDALKSVAEDKVTATFNEVGQLVIKVPTGYKLDFDIRYSGITRPIADIVEKDAEKSADMGFDVYVVKPEFNMHGYTRTLSLFEVNGQYYEDWGYAGSEIGTTYTKLYTLAALQADPTLLLPDEDEASYAFTAYDGRKGEAYRTALFSEDTWMVKLEGEWYIVRSTDHWYLDYHTDYVTTKRWDPESFRIVQEDEWFVEFRGGYELVSFLDAFSSIQVSSMDRYGKKITVDGKQYEIWTIYLAPDIHTWGTETLCAECYIDYNNDIVFYESEIKYSEQPRWYLFPYAGEVGTVTERYVASSYEYYDVTTGQKIEGTVYHVYVEQDEAAVKPEIYLAKLSNGCYVNLEELVSNPAIRNLTTTTLPDGTVMYVINEREDMGGKEGAVEYDNFLYGYVEAGKGTYTEVIAYRMGDTIVDVAYRYAAHEWVNGADPNYYTVKADDTTYIVSAEWFALMKAGCKDPGDYYCIAVSGKKDMGDVICGLEAKVGMYMIPEDEISLGFAQEMPSIEHYWDELFRGISTEPAFRIMTEKAGTVTVYYDNGYATTVYEYELDDRYPADQYMVKDEALSRQYGLNVYYYSFDFLEDSAYYNYALQNGEYYHYGWDYVYDLSFASSLADCFRDNWLLDEVYYYYTLTDPRVTGGTDLRVYKATLYFNSTYEGSIPVYFTVKDGKLMALVGAVEESESVLRFESLTPFSRYIEMLLGSIKTSNKTFMDKVFRYVDGKEYTATYEFVTMTETDASGEVKTHTLRVQIFYQNGVKKYVNSMSYVGEWFLLGEKVDAASLPAEYKSSMTRMQSFYNGSFTIVEYEVAVPHKDYAVKLAGKYYDLEYYTDEWVSPRIDEKEFRDRMSSVDWLYFIYDDNGNRVYYNRLEEEYDEDKDRYYFLLSEPVEAQYAEVLIKDGDIDDLGIYDKNGNLIYEVSAYLPTEWELVAEPQGDGTIFYHHPGMSNGYLKDQGGMYVRATKITTGDGSTYIQCFAVQECVLDEYLVDLGVFDAYVTEQKLASYREDGRVIISKELLAWIEENNLENFFRIRLCVEDWDYGTRYVTLNYYDLAAWFELAEAGKLVPGDVGDPVLQSGDYWN